MASTVVECTVVERECPPCRMPPKTAAAPACPDWAALLTTDLPEAKGQDQEMQAAPDQDQEMEAAASLAWMPLTGSKRRRWQSASWVVAPLQRRRASVKSTRHSYAATAAPEAYPLAQGCPPGPGREILHETAWMPKRGCSGSRALHGVPARCFSYLAAFHHPGRARRTSGASCPTSASSRTRSEPSSSAWAAWAAGR